MTLPKKLTAALAAGALLFTLSACGEDTEGRSPGAEQTAGNGDVFNEADVEFATAMIPHHSQALAMVDMTRGRDLSPEVAELTVDIQAAQGPEVQKMADLEDARGQEFEEMWLEMMIEHHEGAIEMARDEQQVGTFGPAVRLAKSIERSQQAQIDDMKQLLATPPARGRATP